MNKCEFCGATEELEECVLCGSPSCPMHRYQLTQAEVRQYQIDTNAYPWPQFMCDDCEAK